MKISEKFQSKNPQENMNLEDNNKENLLDGNSKNAYKNVDIEKNNKAEKDNNKAKSHFNFFGKSIDNNNQKDSENNQMKYQLLKNSDYDFESNATSKKEDVRNYEILKQEIKQSHIEFDAELNIDDVNNEESNNNTGVFLKENCSKEKSMMCVPGYNRPEDKGITGNKSDKNEMELSKSDPNITKANINKNYIGGDNKESFEDLRKQILENKYDEDDL